MWGFFGESAVINATRSFICVTFPNGSVWVTERKTNPNWTY